MEFFFDVTAPTGPGVDAAAPLAAATTGRARSFWRPMLLGGVFKATGNAGRSRSRPRGAGCSGDLQLWARHRAMPLAFNPHFPINTLTIDARRGGHADARAGVVRRYLEVIFHAMWREAAASAIRRCLPTCCKPGSFDQRIAALAADPRSRPAQANTEGRSRAACSAPTFFVDGAMFFGQDRLDFVRAALAYRSGPRSAGRRHASPSGWNRVGLGARRDHRHLRAAELSGPRCPVRARCR